jgi:hypothetical protein
MKSIALTSLLFITIVSNGQFIDNSNGRRLYDEGTKLLELGDFRGADSLFTGALCTFSNENVYYNRGVSRLMQADTMSCCNDLDIASQKYQDKGAAALFIELCCSKVDTFYYDKNYNLSDKTNYKYFEVVRTLKYYPKTFGNYHEKKAKNLMVSGDVDCDTKLIGMNFKETDIVALYEVDDSTKLFTFCPVIPITANENKYEEMKKRVSIYFNAKYGYLKLLSKKDPLSICIEMEIDTSGAIVNPKFAFFSPNIEEGPPANELQEEISKVVKYYPPFKPAMFMGEKVRYIHHDFIEF